MKNTEENTRSFTKSDIVIGTGAFKTVYKAYDNTQGIEVAWSEIDVNKLPKRNPEYELKRLKSETTLLRQLKSSKQLIIKYLDAWFDKERGVMVLITELMSGSLREFVDACGNLHIGVYKRWLTQLLEGLVLLHSEVPPIIHRDIKADNIFIDGRDGSLRIGDLGSATAWKPVGLTQGVGTLIYVAPETTDGNYDTKVDIWAFGLTAIEIITKEAPYSECELVQHVWALICKGRLPLAFYKIKDPLLRDFLQCCLQLDPEKRCTASELQNHDFLKPDPERDTQVFEFYNEEEARSRYGNITKVGGGEGIKMNSTGAGQPGIDADPHLASTTNNPLDITPSTPERPSPTTRVLNGLPKCIFSPDKVTPDRRVGVKKPKKEPRSPLDSLTETSLENFSSSGRLSRNGSTVLDPIPLDILSPSPVQRRPIQDNTAQVLAILNSEPGNIVNVATSPTLAPKPAIIKPKPINPFHDPIPLLVDTDANTQSLISFSGDMEETERSNTTTTSVPINEPEPVLLDFKMS